MVSDESGLAADVGSHTQNQTRIQDTEDSRLLKKRKRKPVNKEGEGKEKHAALPWILLAGNLARKMLEAGVAERLVAVVNWASAQQQGR